MKKSTINPGRIKLFHEMKFLKFGLIICILLNTYVTIGFTGKSDKLVMEAFELRLDGKSDQAKEMLLKIIKEDSTNAMAQYELARTLNYINMLPGKESANAFNAARNIEPTNVIYAYGYAKNCFLEAFMAMQQGSGDVKAGIDKTCEAFKNVLKLDERYPEALMYLVEIYGMLPENMGGDKSRAEEYTKKLEQFDKFFGAKARLILMPEGTDMVEYWKNFIAKNGENCQDLKELGVAYLFADNFDGAKESFNKAIALDNSQNIRLLDLSRYYQMKVMQNRDAAKEVLPKCKEYIQQYLASVPEPIPPLKAYALGILYNIEMFSGNNEKAEKLLAEAKANDPHFSRAFGLPSLALFNPPDKLDHQFQSFFSPY